MLRHSSPHYRFREAPEKPQLINRRAGVNWQPVFGIWEYNTRTKKTEMPMKWLSWCHSAILIMVLGALAGCSKSDSSTDDAKSADTPNAQSLVDLQNLREVGLLSSADYDAKLAALAKSPNTGTVYDAAMKEQPVESLKNLK